MIMLFIIKMLNEFLKMFYVNHNVLEALNIVRICRTEGLYNIGFILGTYFIKEFPFNPDIMDETALCAFNTKRYNECNDIYLNCLNLHNIKNHVLNRIINNARFVVPYIQNRYEIYNKDIVKEITNKSINHLPIFTFSITTCKRLDLFKKTMNSFINTCVDIHKIDKWICVDDNSSEDDRKEMRKLYPFFTFYFKSCEEKGHSKSMNIIKKLVSTPYLFHMEDDWLFYQKYPYITVCFEILSQGDDIKQCLINKNYAETIDDYNIKGGIEECTQTGIKYYTHEFCPTDEDKDKFNKKYGYNRNCNYWPHFSLRPSLIKTNILSHIGDFNENAAHFELEYSYRFIRLNYRSAFLNNVYSIHIGRLTSERDNPEKLNAYILNNESQFIKKTDNIEPVVCSFKIPLFESYVINLEERNDRLSNFLKNIEESNISPTVYKAINGSKLLPNRQLSRIFDGNDYNMRVGMVGCAMSHIDLYIKLTKSESDIYLILEDDIIPSPNFYNKLSYVFEQCDNIEWDMIYLGHHLYPQYRIENEWNNKKQLPKIEKWNRFESLIKSMGGTGGYLINKKGAIKLLEYINKHGMTNGIDTVQQKSADTLNIYYCYPHLIYSECFLGNNKPDTDIQFNYDSLTQNKQTRLEQEMYYYNNTIKDLVHFNIALNYAQNTEITDISFYYGTSSEIIELLNVVKLQYYTLGDNIIVIIPPNYNQIYTKHIFIDRLKSDGLWDISNSLLYK